MCVIGQASVHHDHIVYIHCGRFEEFCDKITGDMQRVIAEKPGFTLRDHALTQYGECNGQDCPGKNKKGRADYARRIKLSGGARSTDCCAFKIKME
ncbi:MAG: transcriptional repressor [Gallionellaceae bacterium]|nr:transcriptional repressor [Gallionellaceae bacterium]